MEADPYRASLARIASGLATMPKEARAEFLASLSAEELSIVQQALSFHEADGWRRTPVAMAVHLTKRRLHDRILNYRYMAFLGEKFRRLVSGEEPRQIWNMPARYGKSTIASRWGPAWLLDQRPWTTSILTSYGDDLANENAIAVREILREYSTVLRATLRQDRQRMDRFVTDVGGGIMAAGINASITGFGVSEGGILVVDDPFKNWPEAHRLTVRDAVWNNYRSVLRTRLDSENCGILVVHTRWHEDDLTGRLMHGAYEETGDEFTITRLPSLAEEPDYRSSDRILHLADPLGREPGEPLCPERFPLSSVMAREKALGSYLTAGLERQRPAPEEGGEIKRAWFVLETSMPTDADEWLTSWDVKLKDVNRGSFVVGTVWARTGSAMWLLDVFRGRWSMATTINAVALSHVRWPQATAHLVENTGFGPEVMAALRRAEADYVVSDDMAGDLGMTEFEREAVQIVRRHGLTGVLPVNPKGDKVVRARAISSIIEAGDVHLPERASWLGSFLDEVASFPDEPNDQVDSMSQALARLDRGPATIQVAGRTDGPAAPVSIPRPRRRYS